MSVEDLGFKVKCEGCGAERHVSKVSADTPEDAKKHLSFATIDFTWKEEEDCDKGTVIEVKLDLCDECHTALHKFSFKSLCGKLAAIREEEK